MIDKDPDYSAMQSLWDLCAGFVEKHKINCPEVIYQRDSMYELAPLMIEAICDEVGYYDYEDEE